MKEEVKQRLENWAKRYNIPEGEYRGNSYRHIVYLEKYNKARRREAIKNALSNYHVLTDGVKYLPDVLPVSELHTYANHLNSSQILCYNFFGKLLAINDNSKRPVKITPELKKWLEAQLKTIPQLSDNALCEFEAVVDAHEGTSFDFCVYDDKTEVRFEIKFTENGFGKVNKDSKSKNGKTTHHEKYLDIYQKWLDNSSVIRMHECGGEKEKKFFENYQLFRNVISPNRKGDHQEIYNVFIYPKWNTECAKEFNNFKEEYVVDKSKVLRLEWDNEIVPPYMTEFLDKYYF